MSIESAKAFMEKVATDEDFRKEVGEIATTGERVAYVKAAGFDFTMEEFERVSSNRELSVEELDPVAGGGCHVCYDASAY